MFLTNVAVVPLEQKQSEAVALSELLKLSAAIQIQVRRDVGPRWGIDATVAAFECVEDVPLGYWPVAVTTGALRVDGFHFVMRGLPFGLVKHSEQLSIALSHEIIEMLLDPYGQRTVSGPPLDPSQGGQVDYFLEACDACQYETYGINGLEVTDFVLPGYYDMTRTRPEGYSFTGAVSEPREVLERGYITYRAPFPDGTVYEAFAVADDIAEPQGAPTGAQAPPVRIRNPGRNSPDLLVTALPGAPTRAWRELVAGLNAPRTAGRGGQTLAQPVQSSDFAGAFRANVQNLILAMGEQTPPPSIGEVLSVMESLRGETLEAFRTQLDTRKRTLESIRLAMKTDAPPADSQPDLAARYTEIVKYLKQQESLSGIFGPDLDPDLSFWMFMLMP